MHISMMSLASRLLLVLGLACFGAGAVAQVVTDPGDPAEAAETSALATRFVALVDLGKTAETWASAGPILRRTTTQAEWETVLRSMRRASEPLRARELNAARFTKVIDGAPDGHYFVIFFDTTFGSEKFEEKVIYSRVEGEWKIEGYFITPMSALQRQ